MLVSRNKGIRERRNLLRVPKHIRSKLIEVIQGQSIH